MDAWIEFIIMSESELVVVAEVEYGEIFKIPESYRDLLVIKSPRSAWKEKVEEMFGGTPDVIIYWWGLHSLLRRDLYEVWRDARLALIVDTFPNASHKLTEFREVVRARKYLGLVNTFIVSSFEMKEDLRRVFHSSIQDSNFIVITSPFSLRNHFGRYSDEETSSSDNAKRGISPSIIFLGRSDYFYSGVRRMLKDDIGPQLIRLIKNGARVTVRNTGDTGLNNILLEEGFNFYESFDRESMTNGNFSRFVSTFDAQIPIYNAHNSTIRKRVANGLSTRFVQGICSDTPLIIQNESTSGINFIRSHDTGKVMTKNLGEVLNSLLENQSLMRKNWKEKHVSWASESFVGNFLEGLTL